MGNGELFVLKRSMVAASNIESLDWLLVCATMLPSNFWRDFYLYLETDLWVRGGTCEGCKQRMYFRAAGLCLYDAVDFMATEVVIHSPPIPEPGTLLGTQCTGRNCLVNWVSVSFFCSYLWVTAPLRLGLTVLPRRLGTGRPPVSAFQVLGLWAWLWIYLLSFALVNIFLDCLKFPSYLTL